MLQLKPLPNGADSPLFRTDPAPGALLEAEFFARRMDVILMNIPGVIGCGAIVHPDTPAGVTVYIDRTRSTISKTMFWVTSLLDTLHNEPETIEFIERDPPPMLLSHKLYVPYLKALRGITGIQTVAFRMPEARREIRTVLSITLDPLVPDHPGLYKEITRRLRSLEHPPTITSIRPANGNVAAEMTLPRQKPETAA